jgi:Uncharacterized protein, possibly involved in utilization of glycolate and propanediol
MTCQISLEAAQQAISKTMALAASDGKKPVSLCVVDQTGTLLALVRMDSVPERTVPIVMGKAYTAMRMRSSTGELQKLLQARNLTLADYCDPGLTSMPGGLAVKDGDLCLGAVAVSGRLPAEDEVLAERFALYLLEALRG